MVIFCVTLLIFPAIRLIVNGTMPCAKEMVYSPANLISLVPPQLMSALPIIGGIVRVEMRMVVISLYFVANQPDPRIIVSEINEIGIRTSEDS